MIREYGALVVAIFKTANGAAMRVITSVATVIVGVGQVGVVVGTIMMVS
jgi:hypothetical protein